MIVRHMRIIICRKNLVRHRVGAETKRGGIIFKARVRKTGNRGLAVAGRFVASHPCARKKAQGWGAFVVG